MPGSGHVERIRQFLAETFGPEAGEIAEDERLLGEILDSVGVLNLANFLEETYGITIGAHEMDPANFGTLASLSQFVARKLAGA